MKEKETESIVCEKHGLVFCIDCHVSEDNND